QPEETTPTPSEEQAPSAETAMSADSTSADLTGVAGPTIDRSLVAPAPAEPVSEGIFSRVKHLFRRK
ncbi:MAG: hypothetical protein KC414_05270, partial [Romboutsia sp.]|nr:hypothetical protein [Romboutsia sp.]